MQTRKITLIEIEIGAGPLPSVTPVPLRESSWFPIAYVSPDVPPVEGVVPNPVADGVLIEWDAVDQEGVIYIIERGPTEQGPWTEIARVVETRYLYSDGSGQEWWFKITASVRGKAGEGSIIPVKPPPTAQEIIDLIEEQNRLGQEMAAGFAEQGQQIANLDAALNAAEYDPSVAYNPGAVSKWEGGLYYALVETKGNLPSDPTYWKKIGNYNSLAEAVGAQGLQLSGQDIRIEQTEDGLAIVSERVDGVVTALDGKADSSALNSLSSRVIEAEGNIEANSEAITQANAVIAGKASAAAVDAISNTVSEQGDKIEANSLALTNVRAELGGGGNLLTNTAFESGFFGIAFLDQVQFGPASYLLKNPPALEWPPKGANTMVVAKEGNGLIGRAGPWWQVAVEAGKNYILSAYLAALRIGECQFYIDFYSASGTGLGAVVHSTLGSALSGGGHALADHTRVHKLFTAPANAATATIYIFMVVAGHQFPRLGITRPMLEQSRAGQTLPSPWQPGAAGLDTQYAAVTQAIEARTTINENGVAEYRASWTMSLDANGRVAGIRSVNNGTTSTIDFLFDKVRFVSPGNGRRMEYSDGHFTGYDENNKRRIRLGTWSS